MNSEARDLIALAEKLGFTFDCILGSGHVRLVHPNGPVTIPATASDWRARKNSIAQMERVAGQRLPRAKTGRSRKPVARTDFDVSTAARESAAWHATWGHRVAALTERRADAIEEFRRLVAVGDRSAICKAREVLPVITACEDELRAMNQPCEPFDPLTAA